MFSPTLEVTAPAREAGFRVTEAAKSGRTSPNMIVHPPSEAGFEPIGRQ